MRDLFGPKQRPAPPRSTAFCAGGMVVALFTGFASQSFGQFRVLQALDSCSSSGSTILVNGKQVCNSADVLATLKRMSDLPAHHSSPTRRIRVDIRRTKHIVLDLGRDSSNPREYWVF